MRKAIYALIGVTLLAGIGPWGPRVVAREGAGLSVDDWALDLALVSSDGTYRDVTNRLGVKPTAAEGRDGFDADYFTPFNDQYGAMYFGHDDWSPATKLDYDFRGSTWDVEVWNFTVWDWGLGTDWELYWPNISNVPGSIRLSLTESDTSIVLIPNLRDEASYAFSMVQYTSRNFNIVAHVITDSRAPELTAGFTPTAGLTDYIQLYAFPDEPLSSLELTADGQTVSTSFNPGDYNVYQGLWRPDAGIHTLSFTMQDLAGNTNSTTIQLSLGKAINGRFAVPGVGAIEAVNGVSPEGWCGIGIINSQNQSENLIRKLQVVVPLTSDKAAFRFYPPLNDNHWRVELKTGLHKQELPLLREVETGRFYVELKQGGEIILTPKGEAAFLHLPSLVKLTRVFPNPFNNHVTINLAVAQAGEVRLDLFDLQGHLVRTLFSGSVLPGQYHLDWDGTNQHGGEASGGIYFLRLRSGGIRETVKVLYLK